MDRMRRYRERFTYFSCSFYPFQGFPWVMRFNICTTRGNPMLIFFLRKSLHALWIFKQSRWYRDMSREKLVISLLELQRLISFNSWYSWTKVLCKLKMLWDMLKKELRISSVDVNSNSSAILQALEIKLLDSTSEGRLLV